MTREALLARRAILLPLYQNPDPAHDLQWLEVETELAWISEQLKLKVDPKPVARKTWRRDGKALASGDT